ncbi:MAG: hypothetical protein WDN45_08005 [Caulobacteraceae bacterium]
MATRVMTAPPSTQAKIVDVGFAHKALVDRLSPGGRYVDVQSDVDSPWVPFGDKAAIKHLAFDVRQGHLLQHPVDQGAGRGRHAPAPGHDHDGLLEGSVNTGVRLGRLAGRADPGSAGRKPHPGHRPSQRREAVRLDAGADRVYDDKGIFVDTVDVWWYHQPTTRPTAVRTASRSIRNST